MLTIKDFSNYKFRPHAIGNLMKGLPKPLTDLQIQTLNGLQEKYNNGKITTKQLETFVDLNKKKTAKPTLSVGAKTYLEKLYKDIFFNRSKHIKSKYLDKGLAVEDDNINQYNLFKGLFILKNDKRFENDYFTGEPDGIDNGILYEFKSSWDYDTFPLFLDEIPNVDYEYQIQCYLDLLGLDKAYLVYGLLNTPTDLILREKYRQCSELGIIDITDDLDAEITKNMTYDDIPLEFKIKEYEVLRDDKLIEQIKFICDLARDYLNSLHLEIANTTK